MASTAALIFMTGTPGASSRPVLPDFILDGHFGHHVRRMRGSIRSEATHCVSTPSVYRADRGRGL